MSRKRQKLQHPASSEEEDDDDEISFAEFSGTDEERGDQSMRDNDSDDSAEDLSSEDDVDGNEFEEDRNVESSGAQVQAHAPSATLASDNTRTKSTTTQSTLDSGSNIFQVQMSELLRQIRPKHTVREVEAEEAIHAIKNAIEGMKDRGMLGIKDARNAMQKEKVVIPFPAPHPAEDTNLKFGYAKPAAINVVGSYPLKTAARARKFLYIDMVVQMPQSLFQEKDHLDYRYFHKRAYYLACIAAGLRSKLDASYNTHFQYHHDDLLRPVLTVRPRSADKDGKPARHWQINILPAIAEDTFVSAKMTPDKNCIRKSRTASSSTPAYNSSLRADMLVLAYLKLLHKASTTCPAYKDACSLGSTWLRQRGFRATQHKGGLASFEWTALVALLLTGGGPGGRAVLSDRWESSQIFRATLQLLATKDFVKQPLAIGTGEDALQPSIDTPVVWDATRSHNLFHKVTIWSYRRLQMEARTTLTALSDPTGNGFEAAFIVNKDVDLLNSDIVIQCILPSHSSISKPDSSQQHLYNVLRRGLGDRVKSIYLSADRLKPWAVDSTESLAGAQVLTKVGLLVNAETLTRTVDHGPSVEDKTAAAEFRKFWGDKAELRRFKDGSITEALIWDVSPGRSSVLEQVVRYLLKTHLGIESAEDVSFTTDIRTRILSNRFSALPAISTEEFKVLEQDIRTLEGLPLPIRQIVPAQMSQADKSDRQPRDLVMQFESSGRWPDNLAAIQRTKIAFLLKTSELLNDTGKDLTARVGLENQDKDICNQGFLEVSYPTGPAFRVRIFHDREQTLLERQLNNKTLDAKTIELAASALAAYKREYIKRPTHAQSMSQLCSRHPALRETIALLRTWLASHVLINHFEDELIELLAARAFVQPGAWQSANSAQTGFLRTLAWLARWDWRFEPMILDMSANHELKAPAIAPIRTRFEAWRKLDPAFNKVTIFAATSIDVEGTTYTTDKPSKVVVGRMIALAQAATNAVQTQGLLLDVRALFSSTLQDFHFVIHLDPQVTTGNRVKHGAVYKNLELEASSDPSRTGFSPAIELLEELQSTYGSAIMLFSGIPHRPVIAGLWTPQTADRSWKVNLAYSTLPVPATGDKPVMAHINKQAILSEIARLGGELITSIESSA